MSEVDAEVEALNAVFLDDVIASGEGGEAGSRWLRIRVNPDTAGHEALIHASMVVHLSLGADYPQDPPAVRIVSVAGMGDEDRERLRGILDEKCAELAGEAALFELLNICKEFTNEHNVPQEDCCICMCEFDEDEPFVKASCTHAFHCECLARWIHDQRVQADEKRNRKDATTSKEGVDSSDKENEKFEARCAVCRQPIQQDRVEMLQKWLVPLHEAHVKEQEEVRRMAEENLVRAQSEEAARREQERQDKERKEMSEFRAKPLIVIDNYEHSNAKLLKHAMLPLGGLDCRVVKVGTGEYATNRAAVWFSCFEKAEKAVRTYPGRSRVATYRDFKSLPPDFVNR